MSHRIVFAAAFAAAGLLTSAAYAGSPYYDADGRSLLSDAPVNSVVHRQKTMAGSTIVDPRAATPATEPVYTAAMPKMDRDGFEHKESDSSFYEHAVGSDGSVAESDADSAPETPKAQPVYNAPMPKMDPDGFIHKESDSSLYEHAVGSDGAP